MKIVDKLAFSAINLSILDFKLPIRNCRVAVKLTINLSILDFKSAGAFFKKFFQTSINLSILDFKF